jgi:hypothetical protein
MYHRYAVPHGPFNIPFNDAIVPGRSDPFSIDPMIGRIHHLTDEHRTHKKFAALRQHNSINERHTAVSVSGAGWQN